MVPSDLKYVESHEWVRVEGDVVTIGITDFAVEHLSDLTYVDLPETGAQLSRGDRLGEIESVKAVSDLFAPVSGEVVAVNDSLADEVEKIASDPYKAGWMLKVKLTSSAELDDLMDAPAYEEHIARES